jgi:WD40 repeat protein
MWGVFACLLMPLSLFSQDTLHLYDVDASKFPEIHAKVLVRGPQPSSYYQSLLQGSRVLEDQNLRTIVSASCSNPVAQLPLSVGISIDISGSMLGISLQSAKNAARLMTLHLLRPGSEAALQATDERPVIVKGFTRFPSNDLLDAIARVEDFSNNLGNDFVAHLLHPQAGILPLMARGAFRKVCLFYTDAEGPPLNNGDLNECLSLCRKYGITFYPIIVGRSSSNDDPTFWNGVAGSLNSLAIGTGGQLLWAEGGVEEVNQARLNSWLITAGLNMAPSCEITWTSDYTCDSFRTARLLTEKISSNIVQYTSPYFKKASLRLSPSELYFGSVPPGTTRQLTAYVVAEQQDITLKEIRSADPRFTATTPGITPPVLIRKGDSLPVIVTFSPSDSGQVFAVIELLSDGCAPTSYLYVTGGYPGKKSSQPSLKVLAPNGGEVFAAGSTIPIRWTGTMNTTPVRLEFSSDAGMTWQDVTGRATGFTHEWMAPDIESNECLMRASLTVSDTVAVLNGNGDEIRTVAYSPDGVRVATQTLEGVLIWNLYTGAVLRFIPAKYGGPVLSFSSDGSLILTNTFDSLHAWNATTGQLVFSIGFVPLQSSVVDISIDWSRVSTTGSGTYSVWDRLSGILIGSYPVANYSMSTMSDDGSVVALDPDTYDGAIAIFYPGDPPRNWSIQAFNSKLSAVAINQQNSLLAVYGEDFNPGSGWIYEIRLWDLNTQAPLDTLRRNRGDANNRSLLFTPDGRLLIINGSTFELVDLSTGNSRTRDAGSVIKAASLDATGSRLVTGLDNGKAIVWNLDTAAAQNDSSDSLWSIVRPHLSAQNIYLGVVELGDYKDSLIQQYFLNDGAIALAIDRIEIIDNTSEFGIIAPLVPLTLAPSQQANLHVEFQPKQLGRRTATMRVTYQNRYVEEFLIEADCVPPPVEMLADFIDFGRVRLGDDSTRVEAVLVNRSEADLRIDSIVLAGPAPTQYSSGAASQTLGVSNSLRLTITFHPDLAGISQAFLRVYFNGRKKPAHVSLIGEGIPGVVSLPHIEAEVGTTVHLPLRVELNQQFFAGRGAYRYTTTLSFNQSLLVPLRGGSFAKNSGMQRTVTFTGIWDQSSDTLALLPFVVALGDTSYTDIHFESFHWLTDKGDTVNIPVETQDGGLALLGLCPGRFIKTAATEFGMRSVYPNPARDMVTLTFGILETGKTHIELFDLAGQLVRTIWDGDAQQGEYSLDVDCQELPPGGYVGVMRSPTQVTTFSLILQ